MPQVSELVDFYVAFFGGEPFPPDNQVAYGLWSEFAAGLDIPLKAVMGKAHELRGKSRFRPTLADLQEAASVLRSNDPRPQWQPAPCGLCMNGFLEVLFWVNPEGRAVLGHSGNSARLYGTAVPCGCERGKELARQQNLQRRDLTRYMDAHLAIKADAEAAGMPFAKYVDGLKRESVQMFGPKYMASVPS